MTILVTRPSPSGEQLVSRLRQLGLAAYHAPLIEFAPGRGVATLPARLAACVPGDLVFALSQHAVDYAHHALAACSPPWRADLHYYAIGRTTGLKLHTLSGRPVSYPPDSETSETLLCLPDLQQVSGKRALILRGNGGRELLAETLAARGATIDYCECYQRRAIHYDGSEQSAHWHRLGVNRLVVTSGEMLQQLYNLVPDYYRTSWLLRCNLIVVSERLATLARQLGWQSVGVADNADNDALIRALR